MAPKTLFGALHQTMFSGPPQRRSAANLPYLHAGFYRLICGAGRHFGTTAYKMAYISAILLDISNTYSSAK